MGRRRNAGLLGSGLLLVALLAPSAALGALQSQPLTSFPEANGPVKALARANGKLYLGGSFTALTPRSTGPAVMASAGSGLPTGRQPRFEGGVVYAAAPDGSGGYYVGGTFTRVDDTDTGPLVHVTAAGSLDRAFDPKLAGDSDRDVHVFALARAGGRLLVGGIFSTVGGKPSPNLAALSPATGAPILGWGANAAPDDVVLSIAHDGDAVYIAGSFANVGGSPRQQLARLDAATGALDADWSPAHEFLPQVVLPAGGRVYVGGCTGLAALSAADGALLADFASPELGQLACVNDLAWAGSSLLVGGTFSQAIGGAADGLLKLDAATGAVDPQWTAGVGAGDDGFEVRRLRVVDGRVIAAGSFKTARGGGTEVARENLAAFSLSGAGTPDPAFHPDPDGPVYSLAGSGTGLFYGGLFNGIGAVPRQGVAAVDDSTGAIDPKFRVELPPFTRIDELAVAGRQLVMAGSFDAVGGRPRRGLAAVDLESGDVTAFDAQMTGGAEALAVAGSRLYVGGQISEVGGTPTTSNGLAALSAITGRAAQRQPRVQGSVQELLAAGGRLYLAGGFFQIDGQDRRALAALDAATGALDAGWNPPRPRGPVASMDAMGNRLYVGGGFLTVGDEPRSRLAAFDTATGALDPRWAPSAHGRVEALAASPLAVTAAVDPITGTAPGRLLGIDPTTGSIDSDWQPILDGSGASALSFARGHLVAVGDFNSVGGSPRLLPNGDFDGLDGIPRRGMAVFAAERPVNLSRPQLTVPSPRSLQIADRCSTGTWANSPSRFEYAWLRDGEPIEGATEPTYVPSEADDGRRLGCRVTAINEAGAAAADSEAPEALVPPTIGRTVNLLPVSGTAFFAPPGRPAQQLTRPVHVPVGTVVRARQGRLTLCNARDDRRTVQCGDFLAGDFSVQQRRARTAPAVLPLLGTLPASCAPFSARKGSERPKASARKKRRRGSRTRSQRRTRKLWGDGTGDYETRGRYGSAIVQGTKWLTMDRCDGTLVVVRQGAVRVRDRLRNRTVTVRAGDRYLVRAPRRRRR